MRYKDILGRAEAVYSKTIAPLYCTMLYRKYIHKKGNFINWIDQIIQELIAKVTEHYLRRKD